MSSGALIKSKRVIKIIHEFRSVSGRPKVLRLAAKRFILKGATLAGVSLINLSVLKSQSK